PAEESGDSSRSPVMQALHDQLEGAPRPVILLAAELLYVQQLPLSTVTARLKRGRVRDVLSWMPDAPGIPAELDAALGEKGPLTGALGFTVQMREHLRWLCAFVIHWAELDAAERDAALTDPWEFQRAARSTPGDWRAIRYSLQYLTWPGYFQPIVKHDHKTRIRDAFADLIGGPAGIDELDIEQDLHRISEILSAQVGHPVDWYRGSVATQWQRHRDDHSRRAWLVRPGRGGAGRSGQWLTQNRIALPASHLPRIPAHASRLEVSQAVEQGYPHLDYQARFQLTAELHTFLSRMNPQDVVATVADATLHLGTLTDDLGYVEDGGQQLERSVRCSSATLTLDELPSPISELIGEPGTVVDLTDGLDALLAVLHPVRHSAESQVAEALAVGTVPPLPALTHDLADGPDALLAVMHPGRHSAESQVAEAPAAGTVPTLPAVTDDLADGLHMPREELQQFVDVLQQRQQIVFYGPPGTGKTYLAQELA